MHDAFSVTFFSFLRISNLVPYKSSNLGSNKVYFLTWSDVLFSAAGTVLGVYKTKTILEILLPLIPNSICAQFLHLKIIFR